MKTVRSVSDEGTVYCGEQRRAVDVMACYGCERLVDIDLDSRRPKVVCGVGAIEEAVARAS